MEDPLWSVDWRGRCSSLLDGPALYGASWKQWMHGSIHFWKTVVRERFRWCPWSSASCWKRGGLRLDSWAVTNGWMNGQGPKTENGQIGNQEVWSRHVHWPVRGHPVGRSCIEWQCSQERGTKHAGRQNDWPVNGPQPLSSATSSIGTIDPWIEEPWWQGWRAWTTGLGLHLPKFF